MPRGTSRARAWRRPVSSVCVCVYLWLNQTSRRAHPRKRTPEALQSAACTFFTISANDSASSYAIAASTLRSISMPAFFSPSINRL
jgi:hypothetical protein